MKIEPVNKRTLLTYSKNSAIRRSTVNIPIAREKDTLCSIKKDIKCNAKNYKSIDYIYIVNNKKELVGVISYKSFIRNSESVYAKDIMRKSLIMISPSADKDKAADLAVKNNIKAIPVVKNKKLIGVVTIDDILSILNRSLREDILHFAGIHKAHLKYENTLKVPLSLSVLHRIPYLLVGLFGIIAAAFFIDSFEVFLKNYIILAFFIPAIVYMSGAIGAQNQTLLVRDLAIIGKDLDIKKYISSQMAVSVFLSFLISTAVFLTISVFWTNYLIASVISIAMFFSLVITGLNALLITLAIKRFNLDPAIGSGPIATIISDVISIVIYFLIAYALLGGV